MLATEPIEKPALPPAIETQNKNEPMRHVPSLEWIVRKVDTELRQRIDQLYVRFAALPSDDPRHGALETEFRALCRAVDRLAEAARHARPGQPPQDLVSRITWSLNQTVASLNSLDADLFNRRYPFHAFERSKGETTYGALLVVLDRVGRIIPLIRAVDPGIDEQLLAGLVQLDSPLPTTPMA